MPAGEREVTRQKMERFEKRLRDGGESRERAKRIAREQAIKYDRRKDNDRR